jgi:hypothetical protein
MTAVELTEEQKESLNKNEEKRKKKIEERKKNEVHRILRYLR